MRGEVSVLMDAAPSVVWSLVSDVTQVGRFSPETFEAEWLDGATAPAVGVRFRGHVKRNGRGPVYWTTCTVIACEGEREFAFTVDVAGKAVNTWRYRLQEQGGQTLVTESFALAPTLVNRLYWAVAGRARIRTNMRGMQNTLDRIKEVAESDARAAAPTLRSER